MKEQLNKDFGSENDEGFYGEDSSTVVIEQNGINHIGSKVFVKPTPTFDVDSFNIAAPWSPQIYFSVRGAENFHIYLWIAKDLGWSQDWLVWSLFFGFAALGWCFVLFYHAARAHNYEEVYMLIPLVLWLFGNFWWMYGEVVNNDDDVNAPETNHMFVAALSWIAFYHIILRPLGIIKPDDKMTARYEAAGLKCRFSYFANWRQYEHAHTLCWLGKDYSWNAEDRYTWVPFLIPTLLIGMDFIWVTWNKKWMMIDCVHYIAQLFWVIGNMIWALGEIYYPEDDDYAFLMWNSTPLTRANFRWWSSWMLFGAYIPIFFLYSVWLPLTAMGLLSTHDFMMENGPQKHENDPHRNSSLDASSNKGSKLHVEHIVALNNSSSSSNNNNNNNNNNAKDSGSGSSSKQSSNNSNNSTIIVSTVKSAIQMDDAL